TVLCFFLLVKFEFGVESHPMGDIPAIDLRQFAAFAIKVDFVKGHGDPSRPFRTMVDLTAAFASFDRDLVKSVDATIERTALGECGIRLYSFVVHHCLKLHRR
ncbi:MAG: hypothetical protein ACYCVB_18280, partial [Bacilli bacterium]